LQDQCAITRKITAAAGVFAPGHLGELTQVLDFVLVDAVVAETGAVQRRVRLLPARVVVYFVLALALFEHCGYRQVWGKLVAGLDGLGLAAPSASGLCRARRRVGPAPLQALFTAVSGPTGRADTPGVFWRGLRTVAVDGTCLHVRDSPRITARFPKRSAETWEFGYPLLRLLVIVECGTRALLAAAFGPESDGERVYAGRLLGVLDAAMLLLADAGFDAIGFLCDVSATGAQFLVRSSACRIPTVTQRLPDGSALARINGAWRPGHGWPVLTVRVIEAYITVTHADGTVRTEPWRILTSLTDHRRYPAAELVDLYHERWQVETAYFSIKSTILDGRVLRSEFPADIDQEIWALLAVYQAIVRTTGDAVDSRPGLDPDRASLSVALEAARDQVVLAAGIVTDTVVLVAAIGKAVLADLLPARRRQRAKARSRKNTTSKYAGNTSKFPQTALSYTFHAEVTIMKEGLPARPKP
jgi:hypothetical protein